MKKTYLALALIVCAILAGIFLLGRNDTKTDDQNVDIGPVPTEDSIDVTLDFYDKWIAMRLGEEDALTQSEILADPILSPELRTTLEAAMVTQEIGDPDPVLCQLETPNRIRARVILQQDREVQFSVLSRDKAVESARSAEVALTAVNGEWQISSIICMNGESAPEREFSFEREGFLLKSVPEPLDSNFWHLVYEQNGVAGNTVPLFFDENSMCITDDGAESVCAPDTFSEPTFVTIFAQLSEAGAEVKRVQF